MQKSKGFTIIELLVVVAIIAVLTGIVLVNVTGYINKGKRSAVQGDLATMRTNAAVWYDGHSTYVGYAADTTYTGPAAGITSAYSGATIGESESATAWCACSTVPDVTGSTGQNYCVDSTGAAKLTPTATHACSATTSGTTECTNTGVCL